MPSDEFNDSDGSISLDEDEDDGSDIFESDDNEEDEDALSDVDDMSDPEDQPKAKRMKPVSSKDFQKKLKNTTSTIHYFNFVTNPFQQNTKSIAFNKFISNF